MLCRDPRTYVRHQIVVSSTAICCLPRPCGVGSSPSRHANVRAHCPIGTPGGRARVSAAPCECESTPLQLYVIGTRSVVYESTLLLLVCNSPSVGRLQEAAAAAAPTTERNFDIFAWILAPMEHLSPRAGSISSSSSAVNSVRACEKLATHLGTARNDSTLELPILSHGTNTKQGH